MSDERDDGVPPWRDPPPGALDLIRAAREAPRMTKEEEDRSVQFALAEVAAMEAEARAAKRPRWRTAGPPFAAAAAAAAVVLWLWVRPRPEELDTARGPAPRSTAVVHAGHGPLPGTPSARPTAGPAKDAGPDGAR